MHRERKRVHLLFAKSSRAVCVDVIYIYICLCVCVCVCVCVSYCIPLTLSERGAGVKYWVMILYTWCHVTQTWLNTPRGISSDLTQYSKGNFIELITNRVHSSNSLLMCIPSYYPLSQQHTSHWAARSVTEGSPSKNAVANAERKKSKVEPFLVLPLPQLSA